MKTRQQIRRTQALIGLAILVIVAVVVGVRAWFLSFAHQIRMGELSQAILIVDEPVAVWDDPEDLRKIREAFPSFGRGFGYQPQGHSHTTVILVVRDEDGKEWGFTLPTDESDVVGVRAHPPLVPQSNSWHMPRLLGTLGELGLNQVACPDHEHDYGQRPSAAACPHDHDHERPPSTMDEHGHVHEGPGFAEYQLHHWAESFGR